MQTQILARQTKQNQPHTEHNPPQSTHPQFEDTRPEAAAQMRLQSLMANSAQTTQLKSTQAMMAANTPVKNVGQSPNAINTAPLQRMDEEELVQTKADGSPVQCEQTEAPAADAAPAAPNNTGLPDQLKDGIENLSGISMDHVRVHYNSDKPAQLQAHAYAQGSDIHVAPGQEQHLPHEAWHVVQQAQGKVRSTLQMKSDVNDDAGLEREADVMGEKALGVGQLVEREDVGMLGLPCSSLRVTQLYSSVGEHYVWGYGKGHVAPTFEFQQVEASKVKNAAASTIDYGVNANQVFESSPLLRVSDDRLMAVPTRNKSDSKSFFATQAKIDESNTFLHNAGAPLRLTAGAGQIQLSNGLSPFGPTLIEVTPNLGNVLNNSSECGSFAANILGTPVHNAEIVNAGVPVQIPGLGGFGQTLGRDGMINTALAGQDPSALGGNENADPEVGEAFGIYARSSAPVVNIAVTLWSGIIGVKDYLTKTRPHLQWGEHWAGVVAKSGGDYVTLENYNRVASDTDLVEEAVEKDFKELAATGGGIGNYISSTQSYANLGGEGQLARMARLGRNYMKYSVQIGAVAGHYHDQLTRWYFQMYGSGGQSFHEQFKDSAPNGVTFKTRGTDAELKALLVSKLTALLPVDNYQAGADATLAAQTLFLNAATGRANIVAAFAVAERAVCAARLNSAHVFEQGQVHNMMNLGAAHNLAVASVNNAMGDDVNAACLAGIVAMQNS